MMGLVSELDFDEYGLYADLGKRKSKSVSYRFRSKHIADHRA